MGVLDKLLEVMKLDDDYEDDDFFDDDDFDDYEEDKPKRGGGLFGSKQAKPAFDDEEEFEERRPSRVANNKVTPMRQPAKRNAPAMQVCVIKPNTMEDTREITETLLSGRTVILNLEGLDLEIAQRIIDFTSGSTFAINGNLQKISNYIFLVTPANVDISGDLQDLLGGNTKAAASSFDMPSIQGRY